MKARALLCLLLFLCIVPETLFGQESAPYQIGVCDWMILKRQKLGEFALTREIGADGVEMDMGGLGNRVLFDNKLRDAAELEKFLSTAREQGVQVPSIAMSGFFAQNFLERTNYEDLISDCLKTMKPFGAHVAFLPLGGSGSDWVAPGARHDEMVKRLRRSGEMAKEAGVVIGIRTGQDACYDKKLLKEIGSEGIKIYFNMQDAVDKGRDVCKELKKLGGKNICQIHASLTDSVTLDRDPRVDLFKVRRSLKKMKWSGWLVVERSRDAGRTRDVKYNFGTNVAYLKSIFQKQ
jgi:sugar phosphate isomerase/epimerase